MSKIQIGTSVIGKHGKGVISAIITKSTGYVEVDYNGKKSKEMAFNLTGEDGQSLKAKPHSETSGMSKGEKKRHNDRIALAAFAAQSNLDKIKQSILNINGKVQGDRNSLGYQIISERLAGVYNVAKEQGNTFITDVINSVEKSMRASEKQAYVIAKYADQQGIKYED